MFTLAGDKAEQRLRMCRDGRGLGSKLPSIVYKMIFKTSSHFGDF